MDGAGVAEDREDAPGEAFRFMICVYGRGATRNKDGLSVGAA